MWKLQYETVGGAWLGVAMPPKPGGELHNACMYRWHHPTHGTQPARVDDEGRLLGPVELPHNRSLERLSVDDLREPTAFNMTSHSELYQISKDAAESMAEPMRRGVKLLDSIFGPRLEWLDGDKPLTREEVKAIRDQATAEPTPTEHADHHTRAQLVDGLPGEWVHSPSYDPAWTLEVTDHVRTIIIILGERATGYIDVRERNEGRITMPFTRVHAHATDGKDYIMRCAQALRPKVEAVREMVEELRDD